MLLAATTLAAFVVAAVSFTSTELPLLTANNSGNNDDGALGDKRLVRPSTRAYKQRLNESNSVRSSLSAGTLEGSSAKGKKRGCCYSWHNCLVGKCFGLGVANQAGYEAFKQFIKRKLSAFIRSLI